MITVNLKTIGTVLLTAMLLNTAAFANEKLAVMTDQSKVISLSRAANVVVVGNPSIADATINGDKLFVHGHAFGTTNIIVLDKKGEQLAEFEVSVSMGGSQNVALFGYQPRKQMVLRNSYICAPLCESNMQPGVDEPEASDVIMRNSMKSSYAKE